MSTGEITIITDKNSIRNLINQGFVAIVFDESDEIYDYCYNWETAQTMANQGYRIQAIADDGYMEKDKIQRICDYELRISLDCFGDDYKK